MNAKEALQILRDKGTLRKRKQAGNVIRKTQINAPIALAAREMERCTHRHATDTAWMPPSHFLTPLP